MDKIILLTGGKRVGKDTFYYLLTKYSESLDKYYLNNFKRYAFADELKRDLQPLSQKMFKRTIDWLDDKEKEIFRPIMIAYGCAWREIDPLHWVELVDYHISLDKTPQYTSSLIPIITDCRFPNEIEFFKNKYKDAIVVEIERDGGPEPTDEEKKNIPLIKPYVDYSIKWPTVLPEKKLDDLAPFVQDFYRKYFNE